MMLSDFTPYLNGLILISTAALAWFTVRATKRKTLAEAALGEATASDIVTEAALKLVGPLNARIETLEVEIKNLTAEIKEMKKLEEYLQGEIHSRDSQIKKLKRQRDDNTKRIAHLEEVCKKAGINGDDEEEDDGLV